MGAGGAGLHASGAGDLRGRAPGGGGAEDQGADEAAGADDPRGGRAEADGQPARPDGAQIRATGGKRDKIDNHEIARACREAIAAGGTDGFKARAARLLGREPTWLRDRIRENDQLRALFGNVADAEGAQPPREAEVMNRTPQGLPSPGGVELAQVVGEADNLILRDGLKKLGVSEKTLERLKTLDGLAKSSGHFLSISLEKTHRMYFLQLVHLMEVSDDLRERLLAKEGEKGYIGDDEARAYFNRNYAEMVKEAGSGYKLMMEGAQAMVKMLQAAKGDEELPGGGTKKPGWGRGQRSVKPTEAATDA